MDLVALDNAVVCDIARDSAAHVDRPVDIKVLVDNIQIVPFTLEGTTKRVKLDHCAGGQNALDGLKRAMEEKSGVAEALIVSPHTSHLFSSLSNRYSQQRPTCQYDARLP